MSPKGNARTIDDVIAASPLLGGLCLRIPEVLQREVLSRLKPRDILAFSRVGSLPMQVVLRTSELKHIYRFLPNKRRRWEETRITHLHMAFTSGELRIDPPYTRAQRISELAKRIGYVLGQNLFCCMRCRRKYGKKDDRARYRSLLDLCEHARQMVKTENSNGGKRMHRRIASEMPSLFPRYSSI